MANRPSQSNFSNSFHCGLSKSISASAAVVTQMPGTRLTKNSQRHENWSVSQPPTVGPIVGASVATRPMTGVTTANFDRGKTI